MFVSPVRDSSKETWYAVPNDLIGGWCIMTVDKPPSQCDWRGGELEIGWIMTKDDAIEIARLHNEFGYTG